MAKSIRSKWRRKMRSERREKFGKKELEKLKSIVQKSEKSDDVEMKNLYTVRSKAEIQATQEKEIDPKTMRDEHGTFPAWMHPRRRRKLARKSQRQKKKSRAKGKGKKK